jgi:hypothetical protein
MGKAAGIAGLIGGTILLLIGIGLLFGIFASNTLVIIAGQYLILAVIIMALGGFVFSKGYHAYDKVEAKKVAI